MGRKIDSGFDAIVLVVATGLAGIATAQELEAPAPVDQPQPPLLMNAADMPVEGWAVVRYSVVADGSTDDVRVTGIVPPAADPNATIEAVEQWTFEPGTSDGTPIDWHNNESVVLFDSSAESASPSQAFETAYTEIADMMTARDLTDDSTVDEVQAAYEDARDANLELLNKHASRIEELGIALSQAFIIHMTVGDLHTTYDYVRLVTDPRVDTLVGANLLVALQVRLQVEIQLGRTSDALSTYERIAAEYGPDGTDPSAAAVDELRERWENEEIITVLGYVGDRPWRIDAGRRIFTVANIEGVLTTIEAECDTRSMTLDYQPDVEWQLPESLGECTLFVNAEPGTRFSFYELLPAEG